ncbi:MAG: L,D-transpeptidase [Epsilonproteobacteria bacterium]|nr:L,D-transpeptidase [Campylobacterota bacterium]
MIKILFCFLLTFLQNSFASQIDKTMNKHYRVQLSLIQKFYTPLKNRKNVLIINSHYKHKAPYFGSKLIFAKEEVDPLGTYKWDNVKHTYKNTNNLTALVLKKTIYIITPLKKYRNNNKFEKYIKKIDKNHLSKDFLKRIFKSYDSVKPDFNKFAFYEKIVLNLTTKKIIKIKNKKFFILVDRGTQKLYIFTYHKKIRYIGSDKISTGNPMLNSRNDRFFQTPLAVFDRAKYKRGDWHTNKKNFAEYGYKGNRIYYLGKHLIPLKYKTDYKREVHLAIHTTNPIDIMMLGHKASKGCIRITPQLNTILNKSGIIDNINGRYIIIVDSKLSTKENIKRIKYFR